MDPKSRCPFPLLLDELASFCLCVSHDFVGCASWVHHLGNDAVAVFVADEEFLVALDLWHDSEVDDA